MNWIRIKIWIKTAFKNRQHLIDNFSLAVITFDCWQGGSFLPSHRHINWRIFFFTITIIFLFPGQSDWLSVTLHIFKITWRTQKMKVKEVKPEIFLFSDAKQFCGLDPSLNFSRLFLQNIVSRLDKRNPNSLWHNCHISMDFTRDEISH